MYFGSVEPNRTSREATLGQRDALVRSYWNIGTVETNNGSGYQAAITKVGQDIAAGRVPWPSFKLTTNGATKTFDATWAQAAAGTVDSRIIQILDGMSSAAGGKGPIFVTWHHEPNGDGQTAANYLAMNRHMQSLMAAYPNIVHVGAVLSAGYWQMSQGGGWNAVDWMRSDSCDLFGLDIYNPWSPANGKAWTTVDQTWRLGGIAECLAIDPNKPIAIGEWGVRTRPTSGETATWMQQSYDYCRNANVAVMAYWDSVVSGDEHWTLDKNYAGTIESPAPRLTKWKDLSLLSTSKLIPPGGLSS
jgi:hypothetical protein